MQTQVPSSDALFASKLRSSRSLIHHQRRQQKHNADQNQRGATGHANLKAVVDASNHLGSAARRSLKPMFPKTTTVVAATACTIPVCRLQLAPKLDSERPISSFPLPFFDNPGQLEDEVYEFVSRTPNGAAFKVAQTVTMWSCCNEDEWSPGCILIAPAAFGRVVDRSTHQLALNTRSLAHDVYPDSDLESPCSDFMTPTALRRGRLMV